MEKFTRQDFSKDVLKQSAQKKRDDEADMANASASIKRFQLGQRVRLHGLSCSELNAAEGVVSEFESGGRLAVQLTKAPSKVLQQHSVGIRVKWENIQWLSRMPISSMTFHCTMWADDETGRTLTVSECQAKFQSMQDTMVRAEESGYRGSPIRIYNADLRTHTDHMTQLDAREFLQHHIGKLRDAHQLFAGYGIPVNMIDLECLSLYENLLACMHQPAQPYFGMSFSKTSRTKRTQFGVCCYSQHVRHLLEAACRALSRIKRRTGIPGAFPLRKSTQFRWEAHQAIQTLNDQSRFFGSRSFKQCCRFPP